MGVLARVLQYATGRPLWLDEAMLALNILSREWPQLFRELDYAQVAPPAFLVLERAATTIFGPSELALRALPFAAGLALLYAAWHLGRTLLPARPFFLFIALCAFSPLLTHYSNEVKQYGLEALLAVVMAGVLRRVVAVPSRNAIGLRTGLFVAFCLLASTSAPFVIAAAGLAALTVPSVRALVVAERPRVIALVGGAACAGVVAMLIQRHALDNAYLQRFWNDAFLRPWAPGFWTGLSSTVRGVLSGLLLGTLEPGRWGRWVAPATDLLVAGTLVTMMAGLVWVRRRVGAWLAVFIGLCYALAFLLSAAGVLPLSGRHLLFAAPFTFLLIATGVELGVEMLPVRHRHTAWLLLATLFVAPALARTGIEMASPIQRQHVRPLLQRLEAAPPKQVVYVSAAAIPVWTYYTTDWRHADRTRLRWVATEAGDRGPLFHSRPTRGRPVEAEGDDFVRTDGRRTVLYGLPTGRELRRGAMATALPDEGWARNEARRIRAAAGEDAWLLYVPIAASDLEPAYSTLLGELEKLGGVREDAIREREANLLHYRFPTGAGIGPLPR